MKIFNRPILFYDIESYKHDFIVVFVNEEGKTHHILHNTTEGLLDIINNYTLVGYNNYYYDDKMISKMLLGIDNPTVLKTISNSIIERNLKIKIDPRIHSIDVFQEIDVSKPSLKKIQANKGLNIHETSIGFDIERKLTEEEVRKETEYCFNDCVSLIPILKDREDYFSAKLGIIEELKGDEEYKRKAVRWNTTTLVGNLYENPQALLPNLTYFINNLKVPQAVKKYWLEETKLFLSDNELIGGYVMEEFGNKIKFGLGGLHGITVDRPKQGNRHLYHIDVASMYPTIIDILGILGRHSKNYNDKKVNRVKLKKTDPKKAATFKLVLNQTYGVLNSKYNKLYNPKAMLMVALYGQTAIYNIGVKLAGLVDILQFNTDGIYVYVDEKDLDEMNKLIKEWENEWKFDLDVDRYKRLSQRDVNNYISIDFDDNIEVKGSLKKYKNDKYYTNNSLSIVDLAVVNYLLYDIEILDTITDNLDKPSMYQYIVTHGKTFKGIYDNEGNKYQKVNRVFATKEGTTLFKVKDEVRNGKEVESWHQLANLSGKVTVFNGDLKDFNLKIDIDYYYQLALKELQSYNK